MTRPGKGSLVLTITGVACGALATGCRDVDRWSSETGRYEGSVVAAEFVRSGVASDTRLCLTLDTAKLHDAPGTLTSSDGTFNRTLLVPIRPVSHDPLSTMSFGVGRTKNLFFGARPLGDAGDSDVLVIVSLMDDGKVEVRLLRPSATAAAGAGVFAVFPLDRKPGACSFAAP